MKKLLILISLCSVIFISCATKSGNAKKGESEFDFPFPYASMEAVYGKDVIAIAEGTVKDKYDKLPKYKSFKDCVIVDSNIEYFYDGQKQICNYELIYSGVEKKDGVSAVQRNTVIGKSVDENATIVLARCKNLDPYLISSSSYIPVPDGDYWYYFPGMFINNSTNWLDFEPYSKNIDFSKNNKFYLKTTLNDYPKYVSLPFSKNAVTYESEQLIDLDGTVLHLYYQAYYLDALKREFSVGDDIIFYMNSAEKNADGEIVCYVKGFLNQTPEQTTEKKVNSINNKYGS